MIVSPLLLVLTAVFGPGVPAGGPGEPALVIRAAKILTSSGRGAVDRGLVVVRNGKIVWVGREADAQVPEDAQQIDLGDLWLVPGLVGPHSHIVSEARDLNDSVYLTNPDLRTLDVVVPGNPYLKDAVAGGVTTALLLPGSGTNMSGFGTLVKTAGKTVDDMVVRFPGSLKIAQAGNPEYYSWGVRRAFMNWNTRNTLERGLEWARKYKAGEVEWDPYWSNFTGVLDGTIPVSVHTQIYQVVLMTITMQVRDLGLNSFIDHGTFDGYKAGPMAKKYNVPVMNGPREIWFDRSRSRIQGCGAGWEETPGLLLGYNTDAPVLPQEDLPYQAAMALRYGAHDPAETFQGVTSNPAKAMLCDKICGSIQPGLDADLVAWTGFPLDPRSSVVRVWVRGKPVYDVEKDVRRY